MGGLLISVSILSVTATSCVPLSVYHTSNCTHYRNNFVLSLLHERKLILLNRFVSKLAAESTLYRFFRSFFADSELQVLDRREWAELCDATGGSTFCLAVELTVGAGGFKEPGRSISNPVPRPRTT